MPLTEAQSAEQALQAEHAIKAQRGPKVPMPNGQRTSALPYLHQRYQGPDATQLLGSPESILTDPNPKSKYVWRTFKKDAHTAAHERAGILRPVEAAEIDPENPNAEYLTVKTPEGEYVVWENQALFEMPAKWVAKYYTAYENWAVARLAQQTVDFSSKVEEATHGQYKGNMTIGSKGKE